MLQAILYTVTRGVSETGSEKERKLRLLDKIIKVRGGDAKFWPTVSGLGPTLRRGRVLAGRETRLPGSWQTHKTV